MNNDKQIKPLFGIWCQKILPLVYDESLSYYEVLCKVQSKLNEVIGSQNNLQNEFYQLKDWIDSQLETYTKEQLQEWLDDGTLDSIINKSLMNAKINAYKTFNEMYTDTSLYDGAIAYITGYYAVNDLGSGYFLISSEKPVNTDDIFIKELQNGLYATKMVINDFCRPIEIGYKSNTNEYCNKYFNGILKKFKTLILDGGTYIVELTQEKSNAIVLNNNNIIEGNNSILKVLDNYNLEGYSVLYLERIENVLITNVQIDGNKIGNLNTSGQHGMCIGIYASTDITVKNCHLYNAFGDGIELGNRDNNYYKDMNVNILDCHIHDCRRQGISILDGKNIIVDRCYIHNISGHLPECGIDIEPFFEEEKIENVTITNSIFENNAGQDILLALIDDSFNDCATNITIMNNVLNTINIIQNKLTRLNVDMLNNIFKNFTTYAIYLSHIYHDNSNIKILNNLLTDFTYSKLETYLPIEFRSESDGSKLGNITIDVNILNGSGTNNGILGFDGTDKYEDVHIKINNYNVKNLGVLNKNCSLKTNEEWKTGYYQPLSFSYFYDNIILEGSTSQYELNLGNNGIESVDFKITTDNSNGNNITLNNPKGKFYPFNKNVISTTQTGAILVFNFKDNDIYIKEMVGAWS